MISVRLLLESASVLALATAAFGQSFNIDVGDDTSLAGISAGVPPSTYGAAAAQPGFWNTASFTFQWVVPGGVKDLTGALTTVNTSCVQMGNSVGNFYFNNAATFGDDEKLLDDCQDIGNGGVPSSATWSFTGLANGCYDIYVYSWAPDNASYVTFVEDPNQPGSGMGTIVGGPYGGTLVQGAQYARYSTQITTGSITITATSNGVTLNFGSVNGFQFVHTPGCMTSTGTPFCFGTGAGTPCPCGNPGAAGNGCASSVNASGSNLAATGNAQVSNDTIVLQGTGMPNSTCLYFQGTNQLNGGMGVVFGDGLRCAGGTVVRLGAKTNVAGSSQYPVGTDLPVSQKGMIPAAGGTRTYQCWYRNAAAFCTPSTFNLSNGLELVWLP
jgi:hypothetical protein